MNTEKNRVAGERTMTGEPIERAYFERGFIAAAAWAMTKREGVKLSDDVIDHAWTHRDEGMDADDMLPPVRPSAPATPVEAQALPDVYTLRQPIRDVVFAFRCTNWDAGAQHDLSEEVFSAILALAQPGSSDEVVRLKETLLNIARGRFDTMGDMRALAESALLTEHNQNSGEKSDG